MFTQGMNETNEMHEMHEMHVGKGIHVWSEPCDANELNVRASQVPWTHAHLDMAVIIMDRFSGLTN